MNIITRVVVLCLGILSSVAINADIERLSITSAGQQADGTSVFPVINANARFVVFTSDASNFVDDDSNIVSDVFIRDRESGITQRISVSSGNEQADGFSAKPAMSVDARFVAFESNATNLVEGDTNDALDIFVHDRSTGITERVSISSTNGQANANSFKTSISADGRFVSFTSRSSNLVNNDTNGVDDIFVHDRNSGITERVSVSSNGVQANFTSFNSALSADGRFVVFKSAATMLVEDDTNQDPDIFVHDRTTGVTERVSVSSAGVQTNNQQFSITNKPSISASGRFVAFEYSGGLVGDDNNRLLDIYVRDRNTNTTERVSVSTSGQQANAGISNQSLSADGRFVAFNTSANNLVEGDSNRFSDVFVHDRNTGITELVSVLSGTAQINNNLSNPSISADGRSVVFQSFASNLVDNDTNQATDVFLTDNSLIKNNNDLTVILRNSSGVTKVNEYIRFRALFKNNSDTELTNCTAKIVNPLINFQREFSFYSWPINTANPVVNAAIDINPGETAQMNLAVLPRSPLRKQVEFEYACDSTDALTIPFVNTVHLTAKFEPFIAEDFVQLKNGNNRSELEIDRNNGKFWTPYVVVVNNTNSEPASINLTVTKSISGDLFSQPRLCEPIEPSNNNWSCSAPRAEQIQVELVGDETKRILVFVHAKALFTKKLIANRVYVEARDQAGEIVAKNSIAVYTIN